MIKYGTRDIDPSKKCELKPTLQVFFMFLIRNAYCPQKRITAELGNISPVIIVPGAWTEKELNFQAANIAGMIDHNASFNCTTPRLLVTSKVHFDFPQK